MPNFSGDDPTLEGPGILPPATPRRGREHRLMDLFRQSEVAIDPQTNQPDLFGTLGDPTTDYNLPHRVLWPIDKPPGHPNEMTGPMLQELMNEMLNTKTRDL